MSGKKSGERGHVERVRRFYDQESARYVQQRYGTDEPRVARPYLERFRIILELFDADGKTVLDVGCGPGILEPTLLDRNCAVYAVDLSARMAAEARAAVASHAARTKASFLAGRVDAMPFADGAFDAVLCIGVISYLPDLAAGLAEIARVLRPGGSFIVQATHPWAPWELADVLVRGPYHRLAGVLTGRDHRDLDFPLRRYRPGQLEAALRRAGLVPKQRRHYDFRAPFLQQLAPRLTDRIAATMLGAASQSVLGFLGTGYLIKAERVAA